MNVVASVWVLVGAVGLAGAAMVLRETLADWRAVHHGGGSPAVRLYVRETLRSVGFRLGVLAALTAAGVMPALIPLAQRPPWVRLLTVGLLIVGEVLLMVDTLLTWTAKRRYLDRFDPAVPTRPASDADPLDGDLTGGGEGRG